MNGPIHIDLRSHHMFRTKKLDNPTLLDRHFKANSKAAAALTFISDLANDLDMAASEHASIVADAQEQINNLAAVREAADLSAEAHAESARKVRAVFGV